MCPKGIKAEYYPTYEKAREAARRLYCRTTVDYQKKRKEDTMLHSQPKWFYEDNGWVNWDDFLGREPKPKPNYYPTYKEARKVVRAAGILTSKEYFKYRKEEDPRLPPDPTWLYGNEWKFWGEFLGTGGKPHTWRMYRKDEDKTNNAETKKGKKKKKKRESLNTKFEFKYYSYNTARLLVQKLCIKSAEEYNKRRGKIKKLPAIPSRVYKNRGWKSWYDFLNIK